MAFRTQVILLSLLALLIAGSVTPAASLAEPGPFWHHKPLGSGKDEGKIEEKAEENFTAEGKGMEFSGNIAGVAVKITCGVKGSGNLWNGTNLGEAKIVKLSFTECSDAELKECTITVTPVNLAYNVRLAWKYLQNAKELENRPQSRAQPTGAGQSWHGWLFGRTVGLTEEGFKSETESLAEIKFGSKNCGVLGGLNINFKGVASFESELEVEKFVHTVTLKFSPTLQWQHYWNGSRFVGVRARTLYGEKSEASLTGSLQLTTEKQELAVFES